MRELEGPDNSVIIEVPAMGDCWLIAILAHIIGHVADAKDSNHVIRTVRGELSAIVNKDPDRFIDLFPEGRQELEEWTTKIKK